MDELLMAVAGPLFNLLIVAVILILVSVFPSLPMPPEEFLATGEGLSMAILHYPLFALFWVNLILGAFNLFVPALPLDGGRVLRALLSMRVGNLKATKMAAQVSVFFSILLFLLGFVAGNLIILIIAVFIFLGARGEAQAAMLKAYLKGVDIERYLNRKPFTLPANSSVSQALNKLTHSNKVSALVRKGAKFYYFDLDLLDKAEKVKWPKTGLLQVAKEVPALSLEVKAEKALSKMMENDLSFLPVVGKKKKFLGVIEERKLANIFQLRKVKEE
jgi:CBS domain-containing protein